MKTQKKIILSLTVTLLLLVSIFFLFSCKNDSNIPSGNSSKSTLLKTDPIVGKWGYIDSKTNKEVIKLEVKEENGKLKLISHRNWTVKESWILVYNKDEKVYKIIDTDHDFTIEKIKLENNQIRLLVTEKDKVFSRLS